MTAQAKKVTVLSGNVAVGPALTSQTMSLLKTLGYASIIDTMPAESSVFEDVARKELAKRARDCRMEYRQLAVTDINQIDDELIARFRDTCNEIPGPIFVFSRTGKCATALWAAAMSANMSWEDINAAIMRAGHDLSSFNKSSVLRDQRAA